MLIQKNFLNKLKDFGLNSYEAKLWTALLSRGVSTAGELSDMAGVPRSRSYDVLESLEKKGFVMMKLGKPIKYMAIPPEDVVDRVKKKIMSDAEEQKNMLDEIRKTTLLSELTMLFKKGITVVEPSELSGYLKGRKNMYNHMEAAIKNAKKSVVISTTSNGLLRKSDALKPALKKAKDRGVQIKIAAPLNETTKEAMKELARFAEVKNSHQKGRFCITDGAQIIFMMMDDEEINPAYDVGVWINAPFFASAVESIFTASWKDMKAVR